MTSTPSSNATSARLPYYTSRQTTTFSRQILASNSSTWGREAHHNTLSHGQTHNTPLPMWGCRQTSCHIYYLTMHLQGTLQGTSFDWMNCPRYEAPSTTE